MDVSQIKFSVTHPMHSHPYHPDLVSGAGVKAIAVAAEQAGFHGFGFTDHPAPSTRWLASGGHDALDPFVALSYAAAATTTLRLIPNIVVLPYRNPLLTAKSAATLDRLSGGRFTLAVGVGYLRKEFAALGVDFEERAALFDEALTAIRSVWTTDDLTIDGMDFHAQGITAAPRPVGQVPIWIGGNSAAARRRVVEHGDGWCPFPAPPGMAQGAGTAVLDSPQALAADIEDLRRRLESAGRAPEVIDIAFTPFYSGGLPGTDDFNADSYLTELKVLAQLGVTWVQVSIPGDSVEHAVAALDEFGASVIGAR